MLSAPGTPGAAPRCRGERAGRGDVVGACVQPGLGDFGAARGCETEVSAPSVPGPQRETGVGELEPQRSGVEPSWGEERHPDIPALPPGVTASGVKEILEGCGEIEGI